MRIEQFEQFISLAQHQHFRKAAEISNLSTSALTRSIQTLEQDLGCDLLIRSTRSVKLTSAGAVFLQYCQQALDNHALLKQKLTKFRTTENEKIIIGYSPEAIALVPQACGKFMQKFPGVSIEMKLQDTGNLLQGVHDGSLDLAISSPQKISPIDSLNLPEQVLLFCEKTHPILNDSEVTLSAILNYPFLATVSTNQALANLINQTASKLNKLDSLRLGTFEQVINKLTDQSHVGLTTLDQLQNVNNNQQLVNLSELIGRGNKLSLELRISQHSLTTPNISELMSFITLEAGSQPEIALAQATF